MQTRNKVAGAILAIVSSAALLFAYSTGPDPRYTAAPGDSPDACTSCHVGTPLNGGGGSVVVNFPAGLTYTPGVQQTLTIVITDLAARVYGFQMTARLESDLVNGQAGDFTAGVGQYVICDDASFKGANACPVNAPVQFIEHSSPFSTNTISVLWTPPPTDVGNVHIYVAANAANGDGNNTLDHIYTSNYVLTPQAAQPPAITKVQSAGGFNSNAGLASGTWIEVMGASLSSSTRTWQGGDFDGIRAPTSLDGVRVLIGGIPAFVYYVSSEQINVQAPDDPTVGSAVPIVVTSSAGQSNAVTMQKNAIAPALLAPASFVVDGRQWVVAQFLDQTYVGKPGLVSGLNFRPAKVGDVIVIYGIGFGPVTPATPAGTIASGATVLQNTPNIRFGQTPAKLSYAGLAPGAVGLYQLNVIVPSVGPGDIRLNVDAGGVTLDQTLFITIGQ